MVNSHLSAYIIFLCLARTVSRMSSIRNLYDPVLTRFTSAMSSSLVFGLNLLNFLPLRLPGFRGCLRIFSNVFRKP